MSKVYLNGQMIPLSEAKISPLDRGFQFGDGVYEVVRLYDGVPFLLEPHLLRLQRSLRELRIELSQDPKSIFTDLIKSTPHQNALIYVQITRGAAAQRSHPFPPSVSPTIFGQATAFEDTKAAARREGGKVITQADLRWSRCDIKSLNLLGNVLAMQIAKEAGAVEAILVNQAGLVTEGSHTNVAAIFQGKLRTFPAGHHILSGITRNLVLRLAREIGITVMEEPLAKAEFLAAEEVFLMGTTAEVLPIVQVDQVKIGSGRPGDYTQKLQAAFDKFRRET